MTFADCVAQYGAATKDKLSGPGEREALLSGPVANFMEAVGDTFGLKVVAHNEVAEQGGSVRPDFGVRVDQILVGHIELKAPGTSLDPDTYGKTTHNFRQWQRLRELPNLLHTNGVEWRLWRYGELIGDPVAVHTADLTRTRGKLTAPARMELVLRSFLLWEPAPIISVKKLVETLAPLARLLREEVRLALNAERRAVKAGADKDLQPFLGIATDWRALLFPRATDSEFADGFAQTVVFSLVLAVSENIDISQGNLHQISRDLEGRHTLMGKALDLLTEHIDGTPTSSAVEMIARTLSAAKWESISSQGDDIYLHLYEHFLGVYDPEMRKKSGSYYTPVEVVDAMVRLTDDALKNFMGKPEGLRNPHVSIVDPAMGTGTYPLSILRHVAASAAQQYGPGAASEAVANLAARLYGIELQSGPFSVAELRVSSALRDAGADLPRDGLNLYVADTLEDPSSASSYQLSYTLQLIARQRQMANKMKREKNVTVVIANPPYKDHAGGMGGWIENGTDTKTGRSPLDAFRSPGNGVNERHLNNLYAYFWRWATWKVFESTNDPGIPDGGNGLICYITATGYITGSGFKGFREYLRRTCSRGWIIDVSPEGKQPPSKNAVFNIETPVAIAIFARAEGTDASVPADIRYLTLHGTRQEKFAELQELKLDDGRWRPVRPEWTAPFTPASTTEWDQYPSVSDLMPWFSTGLSTNRTWVYGTSEDILEERLRVMVTESDSNRKSVLFKENRDTNLRSRKEPLPIRGAEQDTYTAYEKIVIADAPKIVRIGRRSFDRQYVIADSRLIHNPRRELWHAQIPGQVYVAEQHSHYPKNGPGLAFSSLVPDMDFFNGRGGRVLPMKNPDGTPNIARGLSNSLSSFLGKEVSGEEIVFYISGVCGHPGFVTQFDEELHTPGVRVPITTDQSLWDQAVSLGKQVIWLFTYGAAGAHPLGITNVRDTALPIEHPMYVTSVGGAMPDHITYDPEKETLTVSAGNWTNVRKEVRDYAVGGVNVIDSWMGYRLAKPKGKRTSPLNDLNVTVWPSEWSVELSELLSVLTLLVDLEPELQSLLDGVVDGPLVTKDELAAAGAIWPDSRSDRRPRMPVNVELFES